MRRQISGAGEHLSELRAFASKLDWLSACLRIAIQLICMSKAHWNICLLSKSNLIVRFSRRKVQLLAANSLIVHQLNDEQWLRDIVLSIYQAQTSLCETAED